ncbi:heterokaryon incompatibility protein-domain-containing protein [Pseudoneurospora amorphoporcata]|uniref:Heterokaryon incompatibility protein-domain-containing protein n=1 Tax=Pseudoneurospora amorphoporcata TaxID=241081 RepID=A0AAN6NIW6_9PEZI|nr:heterokaryon incompatibility protein-domain-containing protein [Pseudoneurospora amorphoporcata]
MDKKTVEKLSWSLSNESSRNCWQCLIVLTVAEILWGRALTNNDKVGVCLVGSANRSCCKAHSDELLHFIVRLHMVSLPPEYSHRFFSVLSISGRFPPRMFPGQNFEDSDLETFASSSYQIAISWLESCLTNHPHCPGREETVLPRRLIYVGNGHESIGLVENDKPALGRYICLSHCWGARQLLMTTKSNIEDHLRGIKWENIPKTFQDAINVTRFLGIGYLWIDSLCIIQQDVDDWAEESSKMCSIYENFNGGLPIRDTANFVRLRGSFSSAAPFDLVGYRPPQTSMSCRMGSHPHPHHPDAQNPPLFSRAWVFQERILSPRVLHFNEEELMWECRTSVLCECQPAHCDDQSELQAQWRAMVQEYSALNLSHGTDKLPALSGLAKQLGRMRPSAKYLAGLWSDSLHFDLLWSSHYDYFVKVQRSPETWRAPSWSWAAQNSAVDFPRGTDHIRVFFTIQGCEIGIPTSDITGQVSEGSLVLSGTLYDAQLSRALKADWHKRWREVTGTIVLTLKVTGVQIKSRFIVPEPHVYRLRGEDKATTITMDSPYDLIYPEGETTRKDGWEEDEVEEDEGEEDEEGNPKSEQDEDDHYEKEKKKWGDEEKARSIKDKNEAKIDEEDEEDSEGRSESRKTEHTGQEELLRDDRDSQAQYFDPLGRSSAEYALILQKVEGNNTYRHIGILIQHQSVEAHDAPRPLL